MCNDDRLQCQTGCYPTTGMVTDTQHHYQAHLTTWDAVVSFSGQWEPVVMTIFS